ncbi:peptidoglycan-binding domain-containing protein [Nocardiopsis dassonvillei]|uniref:peptidoglycan-binding domain-containing protein n=1 Tax=Nocardiopsis dassonvillei TaxID=2014 RepID=UPI00362BC102
MTTILDTFDRTVASGWGSTDTGHVWQLASGLVSERSVGAGGGRVTLASSPGTIRVQRLGRPWTDGEVLAEVVPGQTSLNEGLIFALCFRRSPSDGNAFYRARLTFNTDGTLSMDVTRGTTQVGDRVATGLSYTPGARLWLRGRVDGHRVRARVWANGTTEPTTWTVDQTIATDTIPVGDMGLMVSGFANNANSSPWFEVRRVEVTYRLLVDNRLTGTPGDPVSTASLAASAQTGTVTIAAPARAVYDDAQAVLGYAAIRVGSGYHRQDTPQLQATLPAAPWSARWYVWHPSIPAGTGERRWIARVDGVGLASYENASAEIGARLQPADLALAELVPTFSGVPPGPARWLRVELVCDGTTTTGRLYEGHDTASPRQMVWSARAFAGPLALSGFRFRRRTTLYPVGMGWPANPTGQTAELQNELIDLGYDLSPWGADDDYGSVTTAAVNDVQQTYGLVPVDGIAGPETRAAIDLALGRVPDPMWVSHLAVADGQWIGPAEPEPTADTETRELRVGFLPI